MSELSNPLLRVQDISTSAIELENQNGPIQRHLLEIIVSELFPQSHPADARLLRLVFDSNQLALLREHLQQLDLPASTEVKLPPSIQ